MKSSTSWTNATVPIRSNGWRPLPNWPGAWPRRRAKAPISKLVNHVTKLGGNGPIMANALASFGLKVTYLGNLGWPNLHPVFADFAKHADVHSIAEPGHTDALEFDDGKIMIGKISSLNDVNWENIQSRFGRDKFTAQLTGADLVGFVNWTMLTLHGRNLGGDAQGNLSRHQRPAARHVF